jgi:hypothetical protein
MKTIKIIALMIASGLSLSTLAKQIEVSGLFIKKDIQTAPGVFTETKVVITCAIVSEKVCYVIDVPSIPADNGNIPFDPRVQNGELLPENQYTAIIVNGETIPGNYKAHYQHNEITESGSIVRAHTLFFR